MSEGEDMGEVRGREVVSGCLDGSCLDGMAWRGGGLHMLHSLALMGCSFFASEALVRKVRIRSLSPSFYRDLH